MLLKTVLQIAYYYINSQSQKQNAYNKKADSDERRGSLSMYVS